VEDISQYLTSYGYIFLFLYSFGGGFVGLVIASIFAYNGNMQIEYVILTAFISNFLGDSTLVYLAKYQKKDFKKYLNKHKRKLALCRIWIYRYEYMVVFFQKYIYGIKTLIPIVIGLSGYNLKKFIILNFFASLLWALVIGYGSFYLGEYATNLFEYFKGYEYIPMLILISFILIFLQYISKLTQKSI
jgi:membrane protein DedA with SNARE-associated domain